ncbi:MAG: heparinase II/III family protein [Spirochaetes bacterium]|nr:heparinase II/III family protein [Spirochaetota bacterium]
MLKNIVRYTGCLVIMLAMSSLLTIEAYPVDFRQDEARSQDSSTAFNNIQYTVNPPVPFDTALVITGTAKLETTATPRYLGVNLWTENGKVIFLSTPFNTSGKTDFRIPLSKWVFTGDTKNKEPLNPSDMITKFTLYARFADNTSSRFTLEHVAMTISSNTSETKSAMSPTKEALFQGTVSMKPELRGIHPRLFVTPAELESAAKRYRDDPDFYASLVPAMDSKFMKQKPVSFNEAETSFGSAATLARLAVLWRITGRDDFLKAIEAWMPQMAAFAPFEKKKGMNNDLMAGSFMYNFAFLYDMLKGTAPDATVEAVRTALLKQIRTSYDDFTAFKSYPYEQNHLIIPICGLAISAMALFDEMNEARAWLLFSRNLLARSIDAVAFDGWFFESISYWNYTIQYPIVYASALRRVTGEDIFTTPAFRGIGPYLAHTFLPNPNFVFDFADWGPRVEPDGKGFQGGYDKPWHTHPTRLFMYIPMSKEIGDPFLSDLIRHLASLNPRGMGTGDLAFAALWQLKMPESPITLTDRPGYPPWHYFSDMDVVHWRGNWSDSNTTAIAFKSGPPAGHHIGSLYPLYPEWRPGLGHAHPDAGSFILFSRGVFLANDTGYCVPQSRWHNTITVDGKGQGNEGKPFGCFNDIPYERLNKTRMTNVWLGSSVAASTAVFHDGYSPDAGLKQMHRHLIMVDGRFLAILDDIRSEKAHTYDWYLHTDREVISTGNDRWKMENGNARLMIQNFAAVDSFKMEPTIVDTELYPRNNPPRMQQRGFHLNLRSPEKADWQFITALGIQDITSPEKAFAAEKTGNNCIDITDGDDTCRLWIGDQNDLSGTFAFVLKSGGKLKALGFSGTRFMNEFGTFTMPKGGSVTLRPASENKWTAEGASLSDVKLP